MDDFVKYSLRVCDDRYLLHHHSSYDRVSAMVNEPTVTNNISLWKDFIKVKKMYHNKNTNP